MPGFIADQPEPPEFTYRLGMLTLVTLLIGLTINAVNPVRRNQWFPQIIPLLLVAFVGYLLALDQREFLSLSGIAQRFAPMFRVSHRALIYTNIAIVIVAVWGLSVVTGDILSRLRLSAGQRTAIEFLFFVGLSWLWQIDLRPARFAIIEQYTARLTTGDPIYQELAKHPPGHLIEFPFFGWADRPEDDYSYRIGRTVHHKPILNGIMQKTLRDVQWWLDLIHFNEPSSETIKTLRQIGVSYLIARKHANSGDEPWGSIEGLRKISTSETGATLYAIASEEAGKPQLNYDRQKLLNLLFRPRVKIIHPDELSFSAPDVEIQIMESRPEGEHDSSGTLPARNGESPRLAHFVHKQSAPAVVGKLDNVTLQTGHYTVTIWARQLGAPRHLGEAIKLEITDNLGLSKVKEAPNDSSSSPPQEFDHISLSIDVSDQSPMTLTIFASKPGDYLIGPIAISHDL